MRSLWLRALICGTTILGLSGCASLRLYDGERDRQGQAARSAWSGVNLQAMIDAERANLAKLLAAEIDTQQKVATAIRDHTLRSMVQSKSLGTALLKPIEAQLTALAGNVDVLAEARNKLLASQNQVAAQAIIFKTVGLAMPECAALSASGTPQYIEDWLKTASLKQQIAVNSSLDILKQQCPTAQTDLYAGLEGAIGDARKKHEKHKNALRAKKDKAAPLQKAYAQAEKSYDAVAKPAAKSQISAEIKKVGTTVNDAIVRLKESSNPYAMKWAAEKKIEAIHTLAQVITETEPGQAPLQDAKAMKAAFVVLPALLDEANNTIGAAKKPLMLPLLLQKNYEQLNLEAAVRDISASEQIVALRNELTQVLYEQAEQLDLARNELMLPEVKEFHDQPFATAFTKSGVRARQALYAATARYLDALNRLEAKRYILETKLVAAEHERKLANAEVNAKQWESLINTSVSQVADYSATGIKPGEIAEMVSTLGLLSIGVGVNK